MKFMSCCHVDVIVRRDGGKQESKKYNSKKLTGRCILEFIKRETYSCIYKNDRSEQPIISKVFGWENKYERIYAESYYTYFIVFTTIGPKLWLPSYF